MRKNKNSTKQRRAAAKRGQKKSSKEKESKAQKHVRAEKRKEALRLKQRRLENLIEKLSNIKPEEPNVSDVTNTSPSYNNNDLFKGGE